MAMEATRQCAISFSAFLIKTGSCSDGELWARMAGQQHRICSSAVQGRA